jgi:transposase
VPYQLVRQRLDVRASAGVIEIFKGTRRVASHAHEYGSRLYVTDPEHMPASHRAHLEWTPTKLRQWARGSSGATGDFVEALLSSRPHPEHAYRACLGLMSLARRYGDDRLAAACARALLVGAISYTSVKSILAEGLDRLALPDATGVPAPSTHENLRGAGYFSEEA